MSDVPRFWAVVPAAGIGSRMQAKIPKQYLELKGKTVLSHTLSQLLACDELRGIVVALSADDPYWSALPEAEETRVSTVMGGESRAESVLNALQLLSETALPTDWVLVHDAARPCLRRHELNKLMQAVQKEGVVGGILAVPAQDTMKRGNASGEIERTEQRENLWHAQTPQCFPLELLREAIASALQQSIPITDEASALEAKNLKPILVEGRSDNIKITRPADLTLAELYLSQQSGDLSL